MGSKNKETNKQACTALRSVASNNLQFYKQADKKANILIQVNAVIISVLLGGIVSLSVPRRVALIPMAGQISFSLAVILLSLRSTRPGMVLPPHTGENRIDLLHFEDYDQLVMDEYMTSMREMMMDAGQIYGHLTRDIYFQSKVLARKYRYLHWAFLLFLIGLGVNVLVAMGIALL